MNALRWIFCGGALLASLGAEALELEFELTPGVGYRFGGQFEDRASETDADVEPDTAFGVILDVGYAPGEAIEVLYTRQETQVEDTAPELELDIEYFQIGGRATYPGLGGSNLEPFIAGTIGAARFNPGAGLDDETRFAATLGGGLGYPLSEHFGLRFEARAYFTFFDSSTSLFCISDQGEATCRLRASGSLVWQLEAMAGFTFRF